MCISVISYANHMSLSKGSSTSKRIDVVQSHQYKRKYPTGANDRLAAGVN
jgi:hypothetical protein